MQRLLKFKAVDKTTKEVVDVFSFCDEFIKYIEGEKATKRHRFLYYPIQQFTGEFDRKGNDIYEGDIVKLSIPTWNGSNIIESIATVEFFKGSFGFAQKIEGNNRFTKLDGLAPGVMIELIGNSNI